MGVIWTSRKRTRQPGSIALADRSNPLNRGLRGAWDIGTSLQDLSGNAAHAVDASVVSTIPAVVASGELGLARRFVPNANAGEGPRFRLPVEKFRNITAGWTVVAGVNVNGSGEGGFGRIFDSGTSTAGGTDEGFFVSLASSSTTTLQASNSGGSNVTSGANLVVGRWHLVIVTYSATADRISFFVDGKASGSPSSPAKTLSALTTSDAPSIGNRNGGSLDREWDGLLGPIFVYDRAWSAAEARSLGTAAPEIYGLLTPNRRPIFYSIAAGGSSYSAAYDETATATDAFINTAIFAAAVSEQATATDGNTNTAVFAAALSESGTATEGTDGTSAGATTGEISEQAGASDSYGATMVAAASISEQATATDSAAGSNTTSGAISEEATATDSTAGANTTSAAISEQATATDSSSNTLEAAASISESATASDAQTNTAVLNGALAESAEATDFLFGSVPGAGAGDGASSNHDIVKMGRMMGRS